MKSRFREKKVVGLILIGIAAAILFTFIVMGLWNAVLVPVVHVSTVTFWQAAGILLLSKILFGGFKGGGPMGRGRHGWNQEMKDKWQSMSNEEKEQMKQEWRQRCSRWGSKSFTNTDRNMQANKENDLS